MSNNDVQNRIKNFKKNLRKILGAHIRKPIPARLGSLLSEDQTDQLERWSYYGIAGQSYKGEAFMQPSAIPEDKKVFGTPVRIKQDPITLDWEIVGADMRYAQYFFDGNTEEDFETYGYQNIRPGLLTQTTTPSMKVKVLAASYRENGEWHYVQTIVSKDFTLDLPSTNGNALFVTVQLDVPNRALEYKYGAEVPNTVTFTQAYNLNISNSNDDYLKHPDPNRFLCGFVKLRFGMSEITRKTHIYPLQDFLSKGGSDPSALDLAVINNNGDVVTSDGGIVYVEG